MCGRITLGITTHCTTRLGRSSSHIVTFIGPHAGSTIGCSLRDSDATCQICRTLKQALKSLLAVSVVEGMNTPRPGKHAVHPENNARERVRDTGCAQSHPGDQYHSDFTFLSRRVASSINHIHLRSATPSSSSSLKAPDPTTLAPRRPPSLEIAGEERVLREISDGAFAQGV